MRACRSNLALHPLTAVLATSPTRECHNDGTQSVAHLGRRKVLYACTAAVFALAASSADASVWIVDTCADPPIQGTNSLRNVVNRLSTQSGDTIDLTGLTCSKISLALGAINVTQNDLILLGPSPGLLEVSGLYNGTSNDRVIYHSGTGTLAIENLKLTYGKANSSTSLVREGGCISSRGSVVLFKSEVSMCTTATNSFYASGGGIHTDGSLTVNDSSISNNVAVGSNAAGGGAHVIGSLLLLRSSISGNQVISSIHVSMGGGAYVRGDTYISYSTISANSASYDGGLFVGGSALSNSLVIGNSTISGNQAKYGTVGGVEDHGLPITVQNSTIAFNSAARGKVGNSAGGSYYKAAGLFVFGTYSFNANLQSSLLSNNTYGTTEADFSVASIGAHVVTVSGNNNLIRASIGPVRPSTVSTQCPLLGPLRNNGGPTQTHALQSGSPAIDAGNNVANWANDQRGLYPRISGVAADVGAYEVNRADIVFNTGFEGCPTLL